MNGQQCARQLKWRQQKVTKRLRGWGLVQGGTIRAEEHLRFALENIEDAVTMAEECRPRDKDGDGILDNVDECPKVPESFNGYLDEDGCPERDSDGDKIFDESDQCRTVAEDYDGFEDEDGCPEYDNDNDQIVDTKDQCPNEPEDYDAFQDEDGCPEDLVDTDNDGIMDNVDRCIRQPETKNDYMDADGCPDKRPNGVRITETAIVIEDKVYFETAKAVILPKKLSNFEFCSAGVEGLFKIQVEVQGTQILMAQIRIIESCQMIEHSLSKASLIEAGVEAERLQSKGYGEDVPIAENDTAEGKEKIDA